MHRKIWFIIHTTHISSLYSSNCWDGSWLFQSTIHIGRYVWWERVLTEGRTSIVTAITQAVAVFSKTTHIRSIHPPPN